MFLPGNLKHLRKKASISRQRVADHLGISVKNYGHYETGYAQPPLLTAYQLSKYFKTSLTTLIEKDLNGEQASSLHIKDYRVRSYEVKPGSAGTGIAHSG